MESNLIEGVYDLHYIVSSVMADLGETDNTNFKQLLKWAIDGYRRVNLGGTFESTIKTVRLKLDESNATDLPLDYVDYIKIGVCVNGHIINFDYHPNLCIGGARVKKDECGDEVIINCLSKFENGTAELSDYNRWGYLPYFHNGQHVAGYYGLGEGFNGYGYRIDLANRKIYFSSYVEVDEIILEYRTKGIDSTGNAIVPETAISTLTSFVHWKVNSFPKKGINKRASLNDAMYWENQFRLEWKGMVRRKNALTKDEWLTVIRKSIHQLPKR